MKINVVVIALLPAMLAIDAVQSMSAQSVAIGNNSGGSANRLNLASGDGNHYIYSSGSGGNSTYFGEYGAGGDTGWHFIDTGTSAEVFTALASGNFGIGTTDPVTKLQVQTSALGLNIVAGLKNANGNESGGNAVGLGFVNEGSGTWWKAAIVHERTGSYGSGKLHFLVDDRLNANTVTLAQARMTITPMGDVGIGTTSPSHKLSVNGTIRAKEIIVDTGWADYVFEKDYRLTPLSEVKEHIVAKGHLPGIPSAAEVAERGANIGEVQAKLLAKVEELTLHLIAQEERMQRIEKENTALRAQIDELRP